MKVYHTEFAIGNKLLDEYLNKSIQDVEDLHVQYEKLEEIKDIIKRSKLVYLCGNGGSSSTASHFANDLKKMCNINAICLSDNTPLLTAIANDISYIKVFQQQISKELIDIIGKDKVTLVVFSGSGNSQNIFDVVGYGQSLGINVIAQEYGSDPAAVGFDAIKYAERNNIDVVLIDTAGRMHTEKNLMAQIEKIAKVCKPDLKLFIGESITGNDVIEQVKTFNQSVGVDGIILSKADIDEKGGTALSVGYTTGKPILYLGTGQEYKDLEKFDKNKFVDSLGL